MKTSGSLGVLCVLVMATGACKVAAPSLDDDGPERGCVPPELTVVGRHGKGPVTVHPGQTLRLRGVHYTDDCAAGGPGTGQPYRKLQLVLEAKYHAGALTTVRPRGPSSAFTASVVIPETTPAGPAKIFDTAGSPTRVRIVVRP